MLAAVDKANGFAFAAAVAANVASSSSAQAEYHRQRQEAQANTSSPHPPGEAAQEKAADLFNLASQDLEPSYFRTLDIMEKYG